MQFEVQTTGAQLPRGPQGNLIDPVLLELKLISKVFKFSRVFKLSKLVKLFSKLSKLFSEFIFKLFSSVPELVAETRYDGELNRFSISWTEFALELEIDVACTRSLLLTRSPTQRGVSHSSPWRRLGQ